MFRNPSKVNTASIGRNSLDFVMQPQYDFGRLLMLTDEKAGKGLCSKNRIHLMNYIPELRGR